MGMFLCLPLAVATLRYVGESFEENIDRLDTAEGQRFIIMMIVVYSFWIIVATGSGDGQATTNKNAEGAAKGSDMLGGSDLDKGYKGEFEKMDLTFGLAFTDRKLVLF